MIHCGIYLLFVFSVGVVPPLCSVSQSHHLSHCKVLQLQQGCWQVTTQCCSVLLTLERQKNKLVLSGKTPHVRW